MSSKPERTFFSVPSPDGGTQKLAKIELVSIEITGSATFKFEGGVEMRLQPKGAELLIAVDENNQIMLDGKKQPLINLTPKIDIDISDPDVAKLQRALDGEPDA